LNPDEDSTFPEGIKFLLQAPDGEVRNLKVLTDSGAGISCVCDDWVKRMALPTILGPEVRISGVTNTKLVTNRYVEIVVSCPLRTEVAIKLSLVVLLGISEWKCRIPGIPSGLRKLGMYLADPDILGKERELSFPILVGGKYMAELRMAAVYFNKKFALLDSVSGLIPRGAWPSEESSGEFRGFKYRMSYEAIEGLAHDEPEVITVNSIDDKVGDNIQAPAVALSLEDLELNEAILDALRDERMEIEGVL
jgi:hypothetical protein